MTTITTSITQRLEESRRRHPKAGGNSIRCDIEHSVKHLDWILKKLGVTPHLLARMIDNPEPSHVYQWCKGKRGVSAFYWIRIVHLLLLYSENKLDISTFNGRTYWDSIGMGDNRE